MHSRAVSPLICLTASISVVQRWIVPQEQETYVPYLVRNEMSVMQNCQLHICENIQRGGFWWAPELRRLYIPHLISTIFEIFALQDLNSTKLSSLQELPLEARDRAVQIVQIWETLKKNSAGLKVGESAASSIILKGKKFEDNQDSSCSPTKRANWGKGFLVRDTNENQLVTLDWLQRSCMQMGGKFKEHQPSRQGLMADNYCDLMQHAQAFSNSA